jgi:hypothetical protein
MTVGYQNAGKVVALSALATAAKYVSMHTGDPGSAGANELTGGTPVYAAQQATWTTPTTDTLALSNQPLFNIPAGSTVTHVAFRTAATGGDVLWSRALPIPETYAGQGTYTLLSASETMTT